MYDSAGVRGAPTWLRRALSALLAVVLLAATAGAIAAEEEKEDKVDYLSLAALLIRDGHYARADAALRRVDTADQATDLARFHTLEGLAKLYLEEYQSAREAFLNAQEQGQDDPIVHVYLAQAHYNLGDYRRSLDALAAAGQAALDRPELYLMRSQAHWKLGERRAAWDALEAGQQRFPAHGDFLRRKTFLLIQLELYQAAAEQGLEYVRSAEPGLEDYIAIGSALRRSRQTDEALRFLEAAVLAFPDSRDALLELAHTYLDAGKAHAAADLFEKAAVRDDALVFEAAEVNRRAGHLFRALFLNARVGDQDKKLKQRLGILLELKHYGQVASMEDDLFRVGLLENDDVRYALAYAQFRLGDFAQAERHLKQLTGGDAFRKATAVREAMTDCREARWRCF